MVMGAMMMLGNILNFRAMYDQSLDRMETGIIDKSPDIGYDSPNEELIKLADKWIVEAKPLHEKFKKKQDRNENYWLANQVDDKRLSKYANKVIINKVFQSLETIIPRATRRLPAAMVSLPSEEDPGKEVDAIRYANNLENILFALADGLDLKGKAKDFCRFQCLYYLACLKFGYDEDKGIWVENLRPQTLLVPPNFYDEYVIEFHQGTVESMLKRFPDKEEEVLATLNKKFKVTKGESIKGWRVSYYEVTTCKFKFWKFMDVMLQKVKNPHWDDDDKKNHWKVPETDYIFSDLWQLGKNVYSQTTLVDQAISLQDGLNKRKRQIGDNADHANGSLIVYGENGITKKEAAAIEANRGRPNSVTWTEKGVQGGVQQLQGQPLQPYVFEDMLHTEKEIDNTFGTHASLRGEKTPGEETLGGRQLLKDSDQERIDELTQMLERVFEKLFNAFAQLIKIHYTKDDYVTYLGQDGTSVQIKVDKNLIKDGVAIKVRQGSTVTKDKATLASEAIVLWQNKAIDPISFYERIGDPHPYKTAERLYLYQANPALLFKKVQGEIDQATMSDSAEAVLKAVAQAEIENRAFMQGDTSVIPYDGANPQHIAAHQDFMQTEEFAALPPNIQTAAIDHVEAELQVVKKITSEKKEMKTREPDVKKVLDNLSIK